MENAVRIHLVRLKAKFAGTVSGLIFALGVFVATNWLVLKGGTVVGPHLSLLSQYFIGYNVSFVGSLIGVAYALVVGYCCGYSFAWIYNLMVCRSDRVRNN